MTKRENDQKESKRTLVLGASPNPRRYSFSAVRQLAEKGYDVIPLGKHPGSIDGIEIRLDKPKIKDVDTITIYLDPRNQVALYDYVLDLNPNRIIFNPGAENPELADICYAAGIQVENACTLVLLATNTYEL